MANRTVPTATPYDLDRAVQDAVAQGSLVVPPYPAVALRIQAMVQRREYGLGDLARVVAADPALTADVLRCANSALYRRGDPVAALPQAIARIGAQEVARLALGSGLAADAHAPGPLAPLKRTVWVESVASAALCQFLAKGRGLRSEEAFVLGLLHDFGMVVVTSAVEALIQSRGLSPFPMEDWRALVERHHVAAGAQVAERWRLPEKIGEVIRLHHATDWAGCGDPGMLALVRASDQVVALLTALPHVDAVDLVAAPEVADDEVELVVRLLETIPSFIAAFEGPTPRPPATPSAVAHPLTTLVPGERPLAFPVEVMYERKVHRYLSAAAGSSGIVLLGTDPLPDRQLVELALQCQPQPFRVWANVRACRQEGSTHRIEAQLFGLGGEARRLWTQLYASALAPG